MRTIEVLTDEEIEECIDGSSDIRMIRKIANKCLDGDTIGVAKFGYQFAKAIERFSDTEEGSEGWNNNYEWGTIIATSINNLLKDNDQ